MDVVDEGSRYTVTYYYTVTGFDPVSQWDSAVRPGWLLTPCNVTVEWSWSTLSTDTAIRTTATVYGYRTNKDGTRSRIDPIEINSISRYNRKSWPIWLRLLVDNRRPDGVPAEALTTVA